MSSSAEEVRLDKWLWQQDFTKHARSREIWSKGQSPL